MAADTLTLTPGAVAARRAIMFPYPPGRTSADYTRSLSSLTVNSVSYVEGRDYDLSFEEPGVKLKWKAAAIAAGYEWKLGCTLAVPAGGAILVPEYYGALARTGTRAPLMLVNGDSVLASTIGANTSLLTMNNQRGMQFWVPFLTSKRVRSRPDLNFAVNGRTTLGLLDNIDASLASDADYALIQIGTNNIGIYTFEETIAHLQAIWQAYLSAGKQVIALPPLPRDLATQANRDLLWRIIRWIEERRYSGVRNFTVIPTAAAYVDPLSATSAPKTGYSYDGLHPVARGDYYTSKKVAEYFNAILPPPIETFASVADAYHATQNPTGNLLSNGILDGTGGTVGGLDSGASAGSFATSFQYSVSDNGGVLGALTHTGTKITHPVDGRPGQRIRIEGTGYTGAGSATLNASSVCLFNQIFASFTDFSVGDTIRGRGEIIKAATATECLTGLELQLFMTIGGQTNRRADGSSFGDRLPVETFSGTFETPPITLTAVPTAAQFGIRAYLANGVNTIDSSFDIYGLKLEKVV